MAKLDIYISSIKYSIEVSDEELEIFKKITSSLNKKTNELMMKTGKISDRLLLFTLLLINANKKEKIFNNFENNIIKLLKTLAPLLSNGETLDSQLVLSSIIIENDTSNLVEENKQVEEKNDDLFSQIEKDKKTIDDYNKHTEETIKFIDEVINFIQNLNNNLNKI